MNKQIITSIIRIAIGIVFIAGAILKLYPIVPFEILLVKIKVSNWLWVPFIARAIIIFELILGLFIIFKIRLKFIYLLSLLTLLGFTIFLFYLKYYLGHDENCGCFGSIIQIKPIESIIKNLILSALILYALKGNLSPLNWKYNRYIYIIVPIVGIATPLLLNPISLPDKETNYVVKEGNFISDTNLVAVPFNNGDTINLLHDKKLICFLSLKCKACKFAASKLSALNKEHADSLSIYTVFLDAPNREELMKIFLKETDAINIPYTFFSEEKFYKISDVKSPFLMYLNNGEIKNLSNYNDMHPEMVLDFFRE